MKKIPEQNRLSPCLYCNNTTVVTLYDLDDGKYVKCSVCGLIAVDPMPDYEEMVNRSRYWAKKHHIREIKVQQHYSRAFQKIAFHEYLEKMNSYNVTGRVLDIGCGIGSFVYAASQIGWDATGIDIGPAINIAKRYNSRVFQGRLEEMNFPKNYFDVITLFDVVEHVVNLNNLLQLIKDNLRDGGLLIIKTPNFQCFNSRLFGSDWSAVQPLDHLHLFSKLSLIAILKQHKFDVIESKTVDINLFETINKLKGLKYEKNDENSQRKIRGVIDKIVRKKSLQIIRGITNKVLSILNLGENIIVFSENN